MAIACLIIVSTYLVTPNFFDKNIDITKCVIVLLGVTILCQWHFLINVVNEIATALNIRVFRVKEKAMVLGVKIDSTINDGLLMEA